MYIRYSDKKKNQQQPEYDSWYFGNIECYWQVMLIAAVLRIKTKWKNEGKNLNVLNFQYDFETQWQEN